MAKTRTSEHGPDLVDGQEQPTRPAAPPPAGKPPLMVTTRTTIELDGVATEVTATVELGQLRLLLHRLKEAGARAEGLPIRFDYTPAGLPICPRHRVAMPMKERQGDRWHSHACHDPQGALHWCQGFEGPTSPGWAFEAGHPEADARAEAGRNGRRY